MKEEKYTFEMVWQMFAETDKKIKEISKQIKDQSKMISGISDSNGDMAEETIFNSLKKDMAFAGIRFDYMDRSQNRHIKNLNLKGEYDVIMYNCNTVLL